MKKKKSNRKVKERLHTVVIVSDDNKHAWCSSRPEFTTLSVHRAVADFRDSGKYFRGFNRDALIGRRDVVWATSREEACKKVVARLQNAGMTVFSF